MNAANKKRRNKGFTLIELIVVIAVLGILALIAVIRMGGFTAIAQERTDRSNARTLTTIATSYNALPENNNDWPWGEGETFPSVTSEHSKIGSYVNDSIKIVKDGNIFRFSDGRVHVVSSDSGSVTTPENPTNPSDPLPSTPSQIITYLKNSPTPENGYTVDLITQLEDGTPVNWHGLKALGNSANPNPAALYDGENDNKLKLQFPTEGNKEYKSEITAVVIINGEEKIVKYTITTSSSPNQGGPGVTISFEILED